MEGVEAIELIERMINHAKKDIKDNGFYYILWGYLVFLSALIDYFLVLAGNSNHALVWAIAMPAGGIVSFIRGIRDAKEKKTISFVDEIFRYLMIAFTISLFIVCFIMPMTDNNWRAFFPTLMVIYAFALFVSGGILRFLPLRVGALCVWAIGAACYFLPYDKQLVGLALAVLLGFILPGHLLQQKFNKDV